MVARRPSGRQDSLQKAFLPAPSHSVRVASDLSRSVSSGGRKADRVNQQPLQQGQTGLARDWLEKALASARQAGGAVEVTQALAPLAQAALEQGDLDRARACLEEGAGIHRTLRQPGALGMAMAGLATVAEREGDAADAVRHLAAAMDALDRTANMTAEKAQIRERLDALHKVMAPTTFDHACLEGHTMASDDLIPNI